MKVNRYNYAAQFEGDMSALMSQLQDMLLAGRYVLSEEVRAFENEFAQYLGVGFVKGVNTGTDAIMLALKALEIGSGCDVVTQANTFNATVTAIRLSGARPVLVDADERTFLMDVRQLPSAISSHTRAIIPVHLYGKPTPLQEILDVADKRDIHVIEDAAQAHGARLGDRKVGSVGIVGCFSFHPSKNLAACGDGGAVVTNDKKIACQLERIRSLGQEAQNDHVILGLNSKLDAVQARILSWKLPSLDGWNERRRALAAGYRERLEDLPLTFQAYDPGKEDHVYHLFQVGTSKRDGLLCHLREHGVDAVIRYPVPIHLQPAFADCGWTKGQFPVSERLAEELLCLPLRPDMSETDLDYVSGVVREFFCRSSLARA